MVTRHCVLYSSRLADRVMITSSTTVLENMILGSVASAWTLSRFSAAVGLAVVCHELVLAGYGNDFLLVLEWIAELSGALSGLLLASYTSFLLRATALPASSA